MKAMIFAAGRGERMGELTKVTPKPLLQVGGKPLIAYTLERLRSAGITEVIINIAYLGEQIRDCLGDGERFGVTIRYSVEHDPLETGGGILHALPLLGDKPFLIVNADVWTDYPLAGLVARGLQQDELGHLVMVANPAHNPTGDFSITAQEWLIPSDKSTHANAKTYAGIGILHPNLIAAYPQRREKFPLLEAFLAAMQRHQLSGEFYSGEWRDIGTPERLAELDAELCASH